MFVNTQEAFANSRPVMPQMPQPARPMRGLLSGTAVETPRGWIPVDGLVQGDLVYTLDGGLREVRSLKWRQIDAVSSIITVPGGVLGNASDLELLPQQRVLMDDPVLDRLFSLPAALVTARDLAGYGGIGRRRLAGPLEACELSFEEEEVVWVNGGMCLHCDPSDPGRERFFEVLSPTSARLLILAMTGDKRGMPMAA